MSAPGRTWAFCINKGSFISTYAYLSFTVFLIFHFFYILINSGLLEVAGFIWGGGISIFHNFNVSKVCSTRSIQV